MHDRNGIALRSRNVHTAEQLYPYMGVRGHGHDLVRTTARLDMISYMGTTAQRCVYMGVVPVHTAHLVPIPCTRVVIPTRNLQL